MYDPIDKIRATTDNLDSSNLLPFLESYLQYSMRIPQILVRFDCVAEVLLSHTIDPVQDAG